MKEFKGTKGKWSVFKNLEEFAITTIDETQAVCFMPVLHEESEANAKLIASAPEMLEMLEIAKSEFGEHHFLYNAIDVLIKKATE